LAEVGAEHGKVIPERDRDQGVLRLCLDLRPVVVASMTGSPATSWGML
jgi:hypothetical protein